MEALKAAKEEGEQEAQSSAMRPAENSSSGWAYAYSTAATLPLTPGEGNQSYFVEVSKGS